LQGEVAGHKLNENVTELRITHNRNIWTELLQTGSQKMAALVLDKSNAALILLTQGSGNFFTYYPKIFIYLRRGYPLDMKGRKS
jgi:hypothetical protein